MKSRLQFFLIINIIGWTGGLTNWFQFYDSTPIPPIGNPAVTFYLLSTYYLIIKHDFFDLNIVIRRTFLYTILTLAITLIYTLFIIGSEKIFQSYLGYNSFVTTLLAALTIAVLFNPLRNSIIKLLDHYFFGKNIEELSTENLKMKEELQKQDQMKAVATLAAGMAHEIKNPLTSIKTFAEYLPQKYDDPGFREKFSRIVVDEVDRVNNIVKQLLEFSKPKDLELKPESITAILDDTLNLLSSNLLKNKIEVIKSYRDSSLVSVDRNQLKQAFLNLFLNSIQAMSNGGVLTVSVIASMGGETAVAKQSDLPTQIATPRPRQNSAGHVRNDRENVTITISDTGYGIPKDQLEHVFDPFFSTKEGGTGLGLSIVHGIITKHGGKIGVESEINKGTAFNIRIPLR